MTEYYILRHEYAQSGFIDGDVNFVPPLLTYYKSCTDTMREARKVSVRMDKRVRRLKADFFLTTSGSFFASHQFMQVLARHKSNTHFLPAVVKYHTGAATEKSYGLLHAITSTDCLDYVKSEYAGKSLVLASVERGKVLGDW